MVTGGHGENDSSEFKEEPSAEEVAGSQFADSQFVGSQFVGSQACRDCHAEQFHRFERDSHHRSLRKPDLSEEVAIDRIAHTASKQRYRVDKSETGIRHLGWRVFPSANDDLPIANVPIEYVVGSGAFAKSYLFRRDKSLFQSPLAYYMKPEAYAMSPGYDAEVHHGFSREISDHCLFCHVGIIKRSGESENHFSIQEAAIGCERCHGHGNRHVSIAASLGTSHRENVQDDKEAQVDLAIVHPAKLDRQQSESLCASCHLQGDVSLHPAGADAWTFEPGQLLSQSKIEYSIAKEEESITFVGHFSQLHASRCYQESETLSCVSCHSPHHDESEDRLVTHRQNCLKCHRDEECGTPHVVRVAKNDNSCHQCHMPRQKTEVPHTAITDHRIAVHPERANPKATGDQEQGARGNASTLLTQLPRPIALLDSSPVGSRARRRNEAVVVGVWVVDRSGSDRYDRNLILELIKRLEEEVASSPPKHVHVNDSRLRVILAKLISPDAAWRQARKEPETPAVPATRKERQQCRNLLKQVLADEPHASPMYLAATALIAGELFDQKQYGLAISYYEHVAKYTGEASVYYNLGLLYALQHQFPESEAALQKSILLDGTQAPPYRSLGKLYEAVSPERAKQCAATARLLSQ